MEAPLGMRLRCVGISGPSFLVVSLGRSLSWLASDVSDLGNIAGPDVVLWRLSNPATPNPSGLMRSRGPDT